MAALGGLHVRGNKLDTPKKYCMISVMWNLKTSNSEKQRVDGWRLWREESGMGDVGEKARVSRELYVQQGRVNIPCCALEICQESRSQIFSARQKKKKSFFKVSLNTYYVSDIGNKFI